MNSANVTLRLTILGAAALSLSLAAAAELTGGHAIIPVSGSLRGGFGSNFKTSAQIHNRTDRAAKGQLVFRRANLPALPTDPKLSYDLEPRATVSFDDIVAEFGAEGLGSIDVIASEGAVPAIVARVYDDQPEGTNGTGVPLVDTRDALRTSERASLVAPGDFARYRFNVGIRTLSQGAVVKISVYNEEGFERSSTVRTFDPNFFQQQPAADFVLGTVAANDSIALEILSGGAVIYGTTTDNTTNDPAIQLAERDEPELEAPGLVVRTRPSR